MDSIRYSDVPRLIAALERIAKVLEAAEARTQNNQPERRES